MEFSSFISGFVASFIANIFFIPRKIRHHIRNFWSRRILLKFWEGSIWDSLILWDESKKKKVYICFPSYTIPRVGRTENPLGYYVSATDAKAVDLLENALSDLGFKCERLTAEKIDPQNPIPKDGLIILVCGPKLDTITNKVTYEQWTGGNLVSSWFYLRYHEALKMSLSYRTNNRKEYEFQDLGVVVFEQNNKNIDHGLLIKIRVNGQLFFLCWGIHDTATLGAVNIALHAKSLKNSKLLNSTGIMAVVTASKTDGLDTPTASWHPLNVGIEPPKVKKPAPFTLRGLLDPETPVYGLSYLWATEDNVKKVIKGSYSQLSPVAVEFDTSLSCPYNCKWCPYAADRTEAILENDELALNIVDKLKDKGVKLVVLTGGGEPLVSNCVETVVERCKYHGIKVILYTNGLLLNDLRAYHLMSRGVSEIRISLDDVSSVENYNAIHGLKADQGKAMENVRDNTQLLLRLRAKNGFSTIIGVSFLVSNQTLSNLKNSADNLRGWLHEVGPFDYVIIRPAVKYWPSGATNAFFNDSDENHRILKQAARQFKEKGVARHIFISPQRFNDLQKTDKKNYTKCLASTLWMNIGPDGSAYLCCETKHKQNCLLGNIRTTSLFDLQNSASDKISKNFFPDNCPLHLCKPSALNQLFHDIESHRSSNGELPNDILVWLDKLVKHNQNPETLIPSVSGIYEEYN